MADIPIPRELVERNIAFITMIRANLGFPAMTPGQTIYPLRMQVSMDLVGDMIAMSEALRSALTQQAEGVLRVAVDIASGCATIIDEQGDIRAYIPNGKMRVVRLGEECAACVEADLAFAQSLTATPPSPSAEPAGFHICPRHDNAMVPDPAAGCEQCNAERAAQPSGEVLTKEEIRAVEHSVDWNTSREVVEFARAIERATLAKIGAK